MAARPVTFHDAFVGNIGHGFGGGTEAGRRANPTHWQNKWEGCERLTLDFGGEGNAQLGCVFEPEPNPVKTIRHIDLTEVDRPEAGDGIDYIFDQTLKGLAEAHGFFRCQPARFVVDVEEGVVDDSPGATISLWDCANGAKSQPGEILDFFAG